MWLSQVFWQLTSNAAKFTREDGRITVNASHDSDWATVSLTDDGVGVSAADKDLIFQEFHQVRGGMTDKTAGIGIGLSLSKRIINYLGGEIWLESPGEGQGCVVSFTLPIVKPELTLLEPVA